MYSTSDYYEEEPLPTPAPIDGLALVGLVLVLFMAVYVFNQLRPNAAAGLDGGISFTSLPEASSQNLAALPSTASAAGTLSAAQLDAQADAVYPMVIWEAPAISGDPYAFAAPYTRYTLTQGIHGASYGQRAIDLAAGRGEQILSPIYGTVSDVYTDQYGNTTLIIENEVYQVKILHGDYSVAVGDLVEIGDVVGAESNHGYTMDMAGNLCNGRRSCGNHTHLNVYDKIQGININPLDLISR